MNQQLQNLSDQIFDIREKCSDAEYKNIMETISDIYVNQPKSEREVIEAYDEQERIENREFLAFMDEFGSELQEQLERPLRGSQEWHSLTIEQKAKWCKMSVDEFKQDEYKHPRMMDIMYYKSHPESVPGHMKGHSLLKTNMCPAGCVIM